MALTVVVAGSADAHVPMELKAAGLITAFTPVVDVRIGWDEVGVVPEATTDEFRSGLDRRRRRRFRFQAGSDTSSTCGADAVPRGSCSVVTPGVTAGEGMPSADGVPGEGDKSPIWVNFSDARRVMTRALSTQDGGVAVDSGAPSNDRFLLLFGTSSVARTSGGTADLC